MTQELVDVMETFVPISLQEMDAVKLLNRTDTKFVFTNDQLKELLQESSNDYKVLSINDQRYSNYKTLYFDTPDYLFYKRHHNGKENRHKVRIRKYVDSGLCFLEVKNKRKGRTDKRRIGVPDFEMELSPANQLFVEEMLGMSVKLVPTVWNSFSRITLVNEKLKERLTIDTNLSFESVDGDSKTLSDLVITEVKQENISRNTPMVSKLKRRQIRPSGMSKYCIGCVLLNPNLKYNNFKSKLLMIDKLTA